MKLVARVKSTHDSDRNTMIAYVIQLAESCKHYSGERVLASLLAEVWLFVSVETALLMIQLMKKEIDYNVLEIKLDTCNITELGYLTERGLAYYGMTPELGRKIERVIYHE